jgi:hypothetical protein
VVSYSSQPEEVLQEEFEGHDHEDLDDINAGLDDADFEEINCQKCGDLIVAAFQREHKCEPERKADPMPEQQYLIIPCEICSEEIFGLDSFSDHMAKHAQDSED